MTGPDGVDSAVAEQDGTLAGSGVWPLAAQTHSYSGQETLRHIGYNDANEEDDGVQDIILLDTAMMKKMMPMETATPAT